LLARLEDRGLVAVVGEQAGGRGPNAALYAVVPSSAYVAGLDVGPNSVTAGIADITGHIAAEVTVSPDDTQDAVSLVHNAVVKACRSAKVPLSRLRALVIGTPGVVDPRSGDVEFIYDLPHWHAGILEALRRDLRIPVTIENDVNLGALAEKECGAARDVSDFALLWADRGLGLAVVLGGRLHRGASGGAGEIGYLPVPGAALPEKDTESVTWGMPALAGGLGALAGADAVRDLARAHGFDEPTATECVWAAASAGASGGPFLDELATRLTYGVASVTIVLDPELILISGELGRAGGERLIRRIQEAIGRICPTRPRVALSEVVGNPVLRGALFAALDHARDEVFSSPA
jgi:predicted NBD/HSP70 family sugar kinase